MMHCVVKFFFLECKDEHPHCEKMVEENEGYCDYTAEAKEKCRKSCGICHGNTWFTLETQA